VSRYNGADTPREETLISVSLAARTELRNDWTLSAEYRRADNDSTVAAFSYTSRRIAVSLVRTF
jgi:hypothetical protein